ncbi:SusD/RagB family nutrient-binding outer membrane lipoprotein [Dyadobacter subterraneus]|uniref:SusD/RagB family nutrient-binding outer membrane lipoprotein n=1 Tax=Dyadobacter subterraneus TaxID=2773304 RepID=A0ABR9WM58_9BACT|nr:SusD/RagB family nutrient-binding outer membrane lipoprotein [Dyadobacter subterraneus]MBE9466517.1 SusD/RagB family nutrient-binding outer membrane lipoprotein [Dyadobacter subterraneus]
MIRKIAVMLALTFSMGACTKDFEEININPTSPSKVPLDYLLGQAQLLISGSAGDPGYKVWRANFIYSAMIVQQMASVDDYYAGDKYTYNADNSGAYFADSYVNSVKSLADVISQASADPANVNILSIARILKVEQMHIITDLYGDVPYTEAGKAFIENIYKPKYDMQQAIYADMLKELDEAGSALDASKYVPTAADFVYKGDVTKWKKFANSLMLRLAMRMQKADPASAQTWAKKAVDKGIMTSNDDTFAFIHSDGSTASRNPNSYNLGIGRGLVKGDNLQWSKTLIDMMKARKDPRLGIIAQLANGDRVPADQKGLPNGLDKSSGPNGLVTATGDANIKNYSRPTDLMYDDNDPNVLLTFAETQFLKTEAIERGWVTGTAKDSFEAGQKAAVTQLVVYDATAVVSDPAAYVTANPYPASGSLADKMTQIHDEIFILTASTFNHYEGWANWRRTGIPVLKATNYPGNQTGGVIPRRLILPINEKAVNETNYNEAVQRIGGDTFLGRMWWDKQ